MGRNHFSKAGGPYFINDGFSGHSENKHDPKLDVTYTLILGFVTLLIIGSLVAIAL